MDPASSSLGAAYSSVTAIKTLTSSVLAVKIMIQGVKNVEESTRGLREDMAAFEFALTVLDSELRKGAMLHQTHDWWDETKINELLHNATKTFSRLQAIFSDINRRRTALQNMREFYRSTQYDDEIKHLRLRIATYTTALNVPVVLLAVYGNQNSPSQPASGLGDYVLGDRIAYLEKSLGQFYKDIPRYFAAPVASAVEPLPEVELTTQRDSDELLDIAYSLISCASSIASTTESFRRVASTVRRDDGSDENNDPLLPEHSTSISVTGVPLSSQRLSLVNHWLHDSPQLGTTPIPIPFEDRDQAGLPEISASSTCPSIVTPPSTAIVGSHDGFDLTAEIRKRKIRRALEAKQKESKALEEQAKARKELITKIHELLAERKFQEAIPNLERCIQEMNEIVKTSQDPGLAFCHSEGLNLQIPLADTLRNTRRFWKASETSKSTSVTF